MNTATTSQLGHVYNFGILDPRPGDAARQHNEALLGAGTLGLEVTLPALASRCGLGNIDPQHGEHASAETAIERAATIPIPERGSTLVTVRPDLDAIGSMALLELRVRGLSLDSELAVDVIRRIAQIAIVDKHANGAWPGPSALPGASDMWPEASRGMTKELAALSAAVSDFKTPVADRVQTMMDYLVSGSVPAKYVAQVERERADLIAALERGEVRVEKRHIGDTPVALVETTHRAATMIGYTLAPVAVLVNPAMPVSGGDPVRKLTVCQYREGYVDLASAKAKLSGIEPGWGGSTTIIGSPQGRSSTVSVDQVVEALAGAE